MSRFTTETLAEADAFNADSRQLYDDLAVLIEARNQRIQQESDERAEIATLRAEIRDYEEGIRDCKEAIRDYETKLKDREGKVKEFLDAIKIRRQEEQDRLKQVLESAPGSGKPQVSGDKLQQNTSSAAPGPREIEPRTTQINGREGIGPPEQVKESIYASSERFGASEGAVNEITRQTRPQRDKRVPARIRESETYLRSGTALSEQNPDTGGTSSAAGSTSEGLRHSHKPQKRSHNDGQEGTDSRKKQKTAERPRTIDFQEVFQNGQAETKFMIVKFPKGPIYPGKWYILHCDTHKIAYSDSAALRCATRHVGRAEHCKNHRASAADAIREIGVEVLNCTSALAEQNNQVCREAAELIPKTKRLQRLSERVSGIGRSGDSLLHHGAGRRERGATPITGDPVIGEVYSLYEGHYKRWYAGVRLPLSSFDVLGISDSFSSTWLPDKTPRCYRSIQDGTLEWAEGYQDGGPKEAQRKYPVLFFDDKIEVPFEGTFKLPERNVLGWLAAKHFGPFNFNNQKCQLEVRGYQAAQTFVQRLKTRRERRDLISDNPRDMNGLDIGDGNWGDDSLPRRSPPPRPLSPTFSGIVLDDDSDYDSENDSDEEEYGEDDEDDEEEDYDPSNSSGESGTGIRSTSPIPVPQNILREDAQTSGKAIAGGEVGGGLSATSGTAAKLKASDLDRRRTLEVPHEFTTNRWPRSVLSATSIDTGRVGEQNLVPGSENLVQVSSSLNRGSSPELQTPRHISSAQQMNEVAFRAVTPGTLGLAADAYTAVSTASSCQNDFPPGPQQWADAASDHSSFSAATQLRMVALGPKHARVEKTTPTHTSEVTVTTLPPDGLPISPPRCLGQPEISSVAATHHEISRTAQQPSIFIAEQDHKMCTGHRPGEPQRPTSANDPNTLSGKGSGRQPANSGKNPSTSLPHKSGLSSWSTTCFAMQMSAQAAQPHPSQHTPTVIGSIHQPSSTVSAIKVSTVPNGLNGLSGLNSDGRTDGMLDNVRSTMNPAQQQTQQNPQASPLNSRSGPIECESHKGGFDFHFRANSGPWGFISSSSSEVGPVAPSPKRQGAGTDSRLPDSIRRHLELQTRPLATPRATAIAQDNLPAGPTRYTRPAVQPLGNSSAGSSGPSGLPNLYTHGPKSNTPDRSSATAASEGDFPCTACCSRNAQAKCDKDKPRCGECVLLGFDCRMPVTEVANLGQWEYTLDSTGK